MRATWRLSCFAIVDENTTHVYGVARIAAFELFQGFLQQGKPDSGEKFRPHRDQDVARSMIRSPGEYRFGWSAINQDKVLSAMFSEIYFAKTRSSGLTEAIKLSEKSNLDGMR